MVGTIIESHEAEVQGTRASVWWCGKQERSGGAGRGGGGNLPSLALHSYPQVEPSCAAVSLAAKINFLSIFSLFPSALLLFLSSSFLFPCILPSTTQWLKQLSVLP